MPETGHFEIESQGESSMRRKSQSVYLVVLAAAFVLSSSLVGHAQNREKFMISARAGGINAVTGRAVVHARGNSDWELLTIKDDLEAGDMVKTSADGRVEMLLNPGSYMRVGENSQFELADNSLENLEIRLVSGTAIVEATGGDDTELMINIVTPHTRMAIVRRGLYRINVVPGDATELIVRKGRVLLANSQTKVKGGTKIIFSGSTFSMAKLEKADKKSIDSFEVWSKQRAETVAQANRKIQERDLNLLLASYGNYWSRRFSANSSGLWLFNSRFGCFTFLPFYLGWDSPYGSTYTSAFYGGYYGGYYGGRPIYGGRVGNPTAGSPSGSGASSGRPDRNPPPPPPALSPGRTHDAGSPGFGRGKPEITSDRGRPRR
jgi:hypothetical protein